MICDNCGMLTKPFKDGSCEFCGASVLAAASASQDNKDTNGENHE